MRSSHSGRDLRAGAEYRALIGVPGGFRGSARTAIERALAAAPANLTLRAGRGADPDTFLNGTVYVRGERAGDSDSRP